MEITAKIITKEEPREVDIKKNGLPAKLKIQGVTLDTGLDTIFAEASGDLADVVSKILPSDNKFYRLQLQVVVSSGERQDGGKWVSNNVYIRQLQKYFTVPEEAKTF